MFPVKMRRSLDNSWLTVTVSIMYNSEVCSCNDWRNDCELLSRVVISKSFITRHNKINVIKDDK